MLLRRTFTFYLLFKNSLFYNIRKDDKITKIIVCLTFSCNVTLKIDILFGFNWKSTTVFQLSHNIPFLFFL